jgi:hypothetical protein
MWMGARADSAASVSRRIGRITDGPADDQEESNDRDLEQDHQPNEGPGVHDEFIVLLAPRSTKLTVIAKCE